MIISTNIESIDARKMAAKPGHIRIDHNASIKGVRDIDLPIFPKEKITKVDFEFSTTYSLQGSKAKIGHIILNGHLLYKGLEDMHKAYWKKHKKLPEEVAIP